MLPAAIHKEVFANRREAGRALARYLAPFARRDDTVVLALPRGGVPVAYEVARALHAPLDVFLVRKLGVPQQPELAMGAIAAGGIRILNPDVIEWFRIRPEAVEEVARVEQRELERRAAAYRDGRPPVDVRGRIVFLVDDGLATGSSMRAAVAALRRLEPARVFVAVPVGASESCTPSALGADEVLCVNTPSPFHAVGQWYDDFSETTDDEVTALLRASAPVRGGGGGRDE
jgi:predicted phosphoribosyltransferase